MLKFIQIIALVVIPITLIVVLNLVIELPAVSLPLNGQLSDVQKQAISVLIESTKLLISFALAIAGALAFFIKEKYATKQGFPTFQMIVLGICGVSCIMTIFFGQLIISMIVEMLANDIIEFLSKGVVISVRSQYASLLLAVASLILFVYLSFSGENTG